MKLKEGVSTANLKLAMKELLWELDTMFSAKNEEMVVTSGTEGTHMKGSLHYKGLAVDIRKDPKLGVPEVEALNGTMFKGKYRIDVVSEKTHYHIELDRRIK